MFRGNRCNCVSFYYAILIYLICAIYVVLDSLQKDVIPTLKKFIAKGQEKLGHSYPVDLIVVFNANSYNNADQPLHQISESWKKKFESV